MIALRIAAASFLLSLTFSFAGLFITPAWPDAAIAYHNWTVTQRIGVYLQIVPYITLVFLVVSWLSAAALFFGKHWARWSFAAAIGGLVVLNFATALSGRPPLLLSPLEFALSDTNSVLAGLVLALSFFPRRDVAL